MEKILDLPLKKEWYDMIESGIKTEEYREIKPYWCKRLGECALDLCWLRDSDGSCSSVKAMRNINKPGYTHVRFRYGYTKRTMVREIESITIGHGNPDWGAPEEKVFIIRFKDSNEKSNA